MALNSIPGVGRSGGLPRAYLAAIALDAEPLIVQIGENTAAAENDAAIGAPADALDASPTAGSGSVSRSRIPRDRWRSA